MFEAPRRLHFTAIFISGLAYLRHGLWPLILVLVTSPKNEGALLILIGFMGAFLGLFGLIGPLIGYLYTSYVIRDDVLIVNSGWIWKRTRVIPLSRIQNVNTRQNILHRMFGSASVQIETAAGAGVEAELAAVSRLDSIELQRALLQRKTAEAPAELEPPPLYLLTTRQLLIAGVLNNRLAYILVGVAGAFQFDELFRDAIDPIVSWVQRLSPFQAALIIGGTFAGLILIGWLLSVVYSLTRFYGFRMETHPTGLKLSYGLLTRIQTVVPAGRVQSFRIRQPLLYQPFDKCEAYADTAGSFEAKELGAANKLCPILDVEEIDRIGGFVFPGFQFSKFSWKQVSRKSILRMAIGSFVFQAILLGAASIALRKPWPLFFLIGAAPLGYVLALLRYRYVGYAQQDGFIASRQGFWNKAIVVVPTDRALIISVNQSFFQRRWGLADLSVTTSAPAAILTIENLDVEAAHQIQEELSIESQKRTKPWRGGN